MHDRHRKLTFESLAQICLRYPTLLLIYCHAFCTFGHFQRSTIEVCLTTHCSLLEHFFWKSFMHSGFRQSGFCGCFYAPASAALCTCFTCLKQKRSLVWSPVVGSIRFETDNTTSTSHQLSTCLLLNYHIPQGQTFFAILYSLQVCLSMHLLLSQSIFLETFTVFDSQYTHKAFLMFDLSCRFLLELLRCFDGLAQASLTLGR